MPAKVAALPNPTVAPQPRQRQAEELAATATAATGRHPLAACTYRIAFGPRAGQKVLTVRGAELARLEAPETKMGRYKATDSLLRFLQTL